ncbi:MAG: ketoacyl-ACP synthase III [Pseudomonadota bacterium]
MTIKSAGIVGTGLYVPKKVITNDWFDESMLLSIDNIFDEAGVKERRFCAENEKASDMEVKALLSAVKNAKISIDDIELILDGPSLHDQLMPGNAATLQHKSGAKNAASMNVETACTSLISQIVIASNLIATGAYKTIACVVSANWSRVADYTEKSCMFIGDGASAVIMQAVSEGKGVLAHHLETDGETCDGLGINMRLPRAYIQDYQATDYLKSPKERLYFYIDRKHAGFKEIKNSGPTKTPDVAKKALAKAGYTQSDIDFLISHNPSNILTKLWREALDVPIEKTYTSIEKYGNMSAASIGANLHEASVKGKLKDGDIVVMCAPGAGYHYASVVLKWGK